MKITSFALKNYRRLADVTLVLDDKTTVLVGANNSGKTSCIGALHTFLKSPDNLKIRDISKRNWKEIQKLGEQVEQEFPTSEKMQKLSDVLVSLLPNLDIEITAETSEAYKVRDILPDLEWSSGALFVRITYEATEISKLCREFVDARGVVSGHQGSVSLWPKDLCDFLDKGRNFSKFIKQKHYILSKGAEPTANEVLQPLKSEALKKLIRVDVISEQRGLGAEDNTDQKGPYSEKQRLNRLLREYYERVLNPEDFPEAKDLKVLAQQQDLEKGFTDRLNEQFKAPFEELTIMGYPGIGGNPTVEIAAKISGTDALQKSSSVRYRFDKNEEEFLPESYLGLGYQNLIYLTFRLLEFRDKWMRVGKLASSGDNAEEQIEPIHLVLLEEPEVNLHAQVQRVFVSKAYDTLRNHPDLRDNKTSKKDKPEYQTQLVISTHSSHIIDDIDFKDLRYFRRNNANISVAMDHTSIANMSDLFANAKDELLFVKKHLKLTHCDIFFADGVIFVEGQAERLLVPEFISKSFPGLSNRYISMLEVNGAHTHKYRKLVEKLGVVTLVLTDIDSVNSMGKSSFPQKGSDQKTNNDTLKKWHPKKEALDDLVALPQAEHEKKSQGALLYVAYQKPTKISGKDILSRTFEDALILANFEDKYFLEKDKLKKAKTDFESEIKSLSESLYDYVQGLKKGDFAFDCLFHLANKEKNSFNPPEYMRDGLKWLEDQLSPKV